MTSTKLEKIFDGLTWFQSLGFYFCLHLFKQNLDVATYCNFIKELSNISTGKTTSSDPNSNSIVFHNSSHNSSALSDGRVVVQE